MAQALFDDHPIEQYLRESGEVPELMPGGLEEFSREPTHNSAPCKLTILIVKWFPLLLNRAIHVLESTGLRRPSASSEFAERFKYVVISSSLLSSSLSAPTTTRAATPTTPGHYDQSTPSLPVPIPKSTPTILGIASQALTFSLACLVPTALAQGYYVSGLLILAAVKLLADGGLYFYTSFKQPTRGEKLWTTTLDSLEALVVANNTWDNVVGEVLGILENEERTASHLLSPTSLSPSLRITLSSSLHTTQTQCDNVRQLFAALTSPTVLSQLSHMYAPPSPSHMPKSPTRTRPMSLVAPSPPPAFPGFKPSARPPSLSTPGDAYSRARVATAPQTSLSDKRSTWNGSYMTLAGGPSPRRPRHRPNIPITTHSEDLRSPKSPTFLEQGTSTIILMASLIPTVVDDVDGDADAEDESFGAAVLDIQRKRRSVRMSMFNSPPLSSSATLRPFSISSKSHGSPRSTLTSSFGSPFTSLSPPPSASRQSHTLSLSNLQLAVQGALGSKRFTCSHLLALRFSDSTMVPCLHTAASPDADGEDEPYWEDVRSVISLLASTLEDASARLADALADAVRQQEQEREVLTDEESCVESVSPEPVEPTCSSTIVPPSFAPMPSHLVRFAAHVDAITCTLDDAREHLRQCVASLQYDLEDGSEVAKDLNAPTAALQSYERLRRELGLAIRECERGRGTLLEIVQPDTPNHLVEEVAGGESPVQHEEHFSSGESDKTLFNAEESPEQKALHVEQDDDPTPREDDATSHLILTATSQHLPPPGIEQVFESMSAAQPFLRERSKLTREERIRMAKARRESQFSALDSVPDVHEGEHRPGRERWGPDGDVVQELKDVIWKVGEQRRRIVERSSSLGLHSDTTLPYRS